MELSRSQTAVPSDAPKMVEARFRELAEAWKAEAAPLSSVRQKRQLPAYRQIVAIAGPAIPLILADLKRKPSHLFWALADITQSRPAGLAGAKDLLEVVNAWIE
jgi:hypothetical protein